MICQRRLLLLLLKFFIQSFRSGDARFNKNVSCFFFSTLLALFNVGENGTTGYVVRNYKRHDDFRNTISHFLRNGRITLFSLLIDVAIGAPMEGEDGSGAVYIYHGSSKGIKLPYSQVCQKQLTQSSCRDWVKKLAPHFLSNQRSAQLTPVPFPALGVGCVQFPGVWLLASFIG